MTEVNRSAPRPTTPPRTTTTSTTATTTRPTTTTTSTASTTSTTAQRVVDPKRQADARAVHANTDATLRRNPFAGDEPTATGTRAARGLSREGTPAERGPAVTEDKTIEVKSPRTIEEIARKNDVQPALLRAANPNLESGVVNTGDKVFVPGVDRKANPAMAYDPAQWTGGAQGVQGAQETNKPKGPDPQAQQQMQNLLETAKAGAEGKSPGGYCLGAVQDYLDQTQYGTGKVPRLPEAHDYADYLNRDGNAEKLGMQKLNIDNPYDAPPGSIVVVRAGTPGTSHPTAGDIVVKGEGDKFYNDGEMGYGGPQNFPKGNDYVLGVYVPKGGAAGAATTDANTAPEAATKVPPALAQGDTNDDVKSMQQNLERRGFSPGPIDGIYGPQTAAAVEKFNKSIGVEGDRATDATQRALNPQAAAYADAAKDRTHTVKPGDTVDQIARNENVSVALLRQANPVLDRDTMLRAGQKLYIPGVDLQKAPEAAYSPNHGDPTGTMGALPEHAHNLGIDPSAYQKGPGPVPPTTAGIPRPEGDDRLRLQGLQKGDEGPRVASLQGALSARGYEVGEAGKYDQKTANAVAKFHRDQGLEGGPVATVTTQRHLYAEGFLYGKDAMADKTKAPSGDIKLPMDPGAPYGRVDLSTEAGRDVFRQAAKLAGLPESWADSPGLRQLVEHESGGIVGRPNYTYGSRAQDPSQWGAIHDELRAGNITAASSATGLGQLLSSNVEHYYPAGLKGIGDPVQEAAGMLNYIKERYGNPEIAWGNHSANPNRHQGVPVIYSSEGY